MLAKFLYPGLAIVFSLVIFYALLHLRKRAAKGGKKPSGSLQIILFCWTLLGLLYALPEKIASLPAFFIGWNLIVWILFIICICLATLDIMTFTGAKPDKDKRKASLSALALCILFICAFIFYILPRVMGAHMEHRRILDKRDLLEGMSEIQDDQGARMPLEDFVSRKFNYRVYAGNTPWYWSLELGKAFPFAEIAAKHSKEVSLIVLPVFFMNDQPDVDVYIDAMLQVIGFDPQALKQGRWQKQMQDGFEGVIVDFERRVKQAELKYKLKAMLDEKKFGYLVVAWAEDELPELNQIHERFARKSASPALPDPRKFTPAEKQRHSKVYYQVGIEYMRRNEIEKSISFFRDAHELAPKQQAYLGNLISAMMEAGQYKEAHAYLSALKPLTPNQSSLLNVIEQLEQTPTEPNKREKARDLFSESFKDSTKPKLSGIYPSDLSESIPSASGGTSEAKTSGKSGAGGGKGTSKVSASDTSLNQAGVFRQMLMQRSQEVQKD